jgi:hypothetical protein
VTTPPNPPNGDDNLYGGPPPPAQDPYGSAPYSGGGQPPQNPYGSSYPGGGQPEGQKTDGVSIAAFVTGLLCCAPVGLILGFVGLRRTKDGQRKGRWAAVTGLILGSLGVLAWIGAAIFIVFIVNNVVTPDNAEVGQCIGIDEEDGEVTMMKKECGEKHDGEIVAVEELDSDTASTAEDLQVAYCNEIIEEGDLTTILDRDDLELQAVFEDPNNVEDGDHIVCYVEATKGDLDEKVLD